MKSIITILLMSISFYATAQTVSYTTKQKALPCVDMTYSVVVHVVENHPALTSINPAAIQSAIDTLNRYFEPICVRFRLCEIREMDNIQYRFLNILWEWEDMLTRHHLKNRINIFYVDGYSQDFLRGWTTHGGIKDPDHGGLSLRKSDGETGQFLLHEMGHYFGLYDTFHDGFGYELVDGSNSAVAGDSLIDTPADNWYMGCTAEDYYERNLDGSCRFVSLELDANGDYFNPSMANIMSEYPCACSFTHGQYQRMATFAKLSAPMW